jgi:hypothetical protein
MFTGSVSLRRYGSRILWTWQPEAVARHQEGFARGQPPGKGHIAVQDHEEGDARDQPEEDLLRSTVTKTDVNCTSRNQSQSVEKPTIWPAVFRRTTVARARINQVRPRIRIA